MRTVTAMALPSRPRILVVALRRLGDVLLTTPLIRSLRRAWPDARIEALVFADTVGILEGNPDVDNIIAMPQRANTRQSLKLAAELWRRYDLAVSTQAGDRPTFFAIMAGRRRVGPLQERLSGRIFRLFLDRWLVPDGIRHRVQENLRLAELLGIVPIGQMVAPTTRHPEFCPPQGSYAVIHAAPFFRYKQWHRDGWRTVARHLRGRGLEIVATGGPAAAECGYLDDIWNGIPVRRMDGRLSWPELSAVLAGARVFIGPDTSVTHLSAAAGCPTVALYGPTDPQIWGPWPRGGLAEPWCKAGTVQRRGMVWLIQNPLPCMPCQREGCLGRLDSHSRCLDEMLASQVILAVDQALTSSSSSALESGACRQTPL